MGDEHPEEAKLEKSNASPGVASGKSERASSKRQRAEERRRVARRRELRKRSIRIALLSLVIFVPALWAFDMSANEEIVDAVVIQTQRYSHYNERSGTHFHLRATILVDGKSEQQITRADGYERGQRVKVWARKGRITGWPYYNDLVKPGELDAQLGPQSSTETNSM
jgi:hypothetical protein